MGLFSNNTFNSLNDLLIEQLQDLYDAEHRLIEALPKMRDAATSSELKNAFDMHLEKTRGHVRRLENVFSQLGIASERQTCPAMKGLIKEGQEMIDAEGDPMVKDAALIAAAQRVEHYEMAGYGTVRSIARRLGLPEVADTLQMTLNEEGAADKKLTQISEETSPAASASAVQINAMNA
jgi:ferritin-like metal-binding protein YciE